MLQCPWKQAVDKDAQLWSKRLESLRKDVERTFGALKTRFRVLKVPCMWQNPEHLDKEFQFCCILHNMIHDWHGSGDEATREANWLQQEMAAGFEDDDSESAEQRATARTRKRKAGEPLTRDADYDASQIGLHDMVVEPEEDKEFMKLRIALLEHYTVACKSVEQSAQPVWLH
jgi:hypothetical protein